MKNSEIAERSIEIMERDGWRRGSYGAVGLQGCLVGTVRKALAEEDSLHMTMVSPEAAAGVLFPVLQNVVLFESSTYFSLKLNTVLEFNDGMVRNREEAIETLTKVAKYWRDRGE